ncbi:MAG: hypothetical protein HY892_09695 [Deltaproteobacteria bacterium]|nr:hypothetical protein [Deltaproteobacteria bacterium]
MKTKEKITLWLKKRTEDLMAQGYREMAEEDREFSEITLEAQREVNSDECLPLAR